MEKCIIVAISDNNAIGRDNALLWHISEDLKFFRRTTLGCPVIMGRKTYESIGRPLPKRTNIVVSRGSEAPERCFVIGGGQVYAQALDMADRLIVTHVHTVIDDADTFFPQIDSQIWKVDTRSEIMTDPETGWNFEFVEYINSLNK